MQIVDVLRRDAHIPAAGFPFGQHAMRPIRLRRSHHRIKPGRKAIERRRIRPEGSNIEHIGIPLVRVQPGRRAEIGNTRFGGNAGAAENGQPPGMTYTLGRALDDRG